jgi:hypothetical protein
LRLDVELAFERSGTSGLGEFARSQPRRFGLSDGALDRRCDIVAPRCVDSIGNGGSHEIDLRANTAGDDQPQMTRAPAGAQTQAELAAMRGQAIEIDNDGIR